MLIFKRTGGEALTPRSIHLTVRRTMQNESLQEAIDRVVASMPPLT
jgi:hypothetical protein